MTSGNGPLAWRFAGDPRREVPQQCTSTAGTGVRSEQPIRGRVARRNYFPVDPLLPDELPELLLPDAPVEPEVLPVPWPPEAPLPATGTENTPSSGKIKENPLLRLSPSKDRTGRGDK